MALVALGMALAALVMALEALVMVLEALGMAYVTLVMALVASRLPWRWPLRKLGNLDLNENISILIKKAGRESKLLAVTDALIGQH